MLWWAAALAWWRTRSTNRLAAVSLQARVAALEETVRKMSDAVFTKQLVTRKVTLVDETGQMRVTLAVGDDGTSGLMFLGEDRRVRIIISVKDGRPGIYLYDVDGKVRAAMSIYNDRATIKVSGTGLAESMLTACKDIVATIITDNDGKPRCILFGDQHAPSIYSWLMLLGAEGERVFTAPPDGYPDRGDGPDWKKVFGGV